MLHARILSYLDEIERSGSIRRAAARLNVASSAINRQILDLEASLGVALFERLPRRMRPTAAGEVLLAHVRRTLRDYRATEAVLGELKGLHGGEVSLATMNGIAGGLLPGVLARFGARFPRIKVTTRVLFAPEIVRATVEGEVQLGLGYHLPDTPGLVTALRLDGRLGAVVAPGHPLAGRGSVSLAECAGCRLILADPGMRMHHVVRDAFARGGLAAEPAYLSNSIELMKRLAQSGDGVAFLSRFDTIEEQRSGVLRYIEVQDGVRLDNPLALVLRSREALDPAATSFAAWLEQELRDVAPAEIR